jgi:hypothetical protein
MRKFLHILPAFGLALALMGMVPHSVAHAQAQSPHVALYALCSDLPNNTDCNNRDPIQQGCNDANVYSVYKTYFTGGYVELRYSPDCETNWSRVTSTVGNATITADIYRESGVDGGALHYSYTAGGTTLAYTNMVFAPNNKAYACGTINGHSGCTPTSA